MNFIRLLVCCSFVCLAACSSSTGGKEASNTQPVSVMPGTYAFASPQQGRPVDPTCAENFGGIVGHLEHLMAQKNSGQAAVSP